MPRPTSKHDLLEASTAQFNKLQTCISDLSPEDQEASFDFSGVKHGKEAHWQRDQNLRDTLAHLYGWHQLLLEWVRTNQNGERRPFLPDPYNWRSYGDMNVELRERYASTPLADVQRMLADSHRQVLELIGQFTDEELFERGQFDWTGTTTLGSYIISATSSHYDWATKKVRAHTRAIKIRHNSQSNIS